MSEQPQFPPIGETVDAYREAQEAAIAAIETEDDIEEIAFDVLDRDEYAQYLMERIEAIRANNGDTSNFVRERQKLLREVKIELALMSGVEIDAIEHARQRSEYRNRIKQSLEAVDKGDTDEKIMQQLGIIEPVSGEAGYRFTFPVKIFPPYVQEQWDVYMEMVRQSDAAAQKAKRGLINQTELNGVDLTRKKAHDTVSHSIGEILEFNDWELDDYRRFVAKMRDKQAAKSMGELSRYADDFKSEFMNEHLSIINEEIRKHR